MNKSFVNVLAAHLLHSYGTGDALAQVLVVLPSNRACLALREAMLHRAGGVPLLLPHMLGLGELGDAFSEILIPEIAETLAQLPPAITPLKRHIMLTELVAASLHASFPQMRADKAQAALLANDLAQLLDDMAREERDFSGLAQLVPEELAGHWQRSVEFLQIIALHWPRILQEQDLCEPLARRAAAMKALAEYWQKNPPAYPVIAAGSTGSQAATRRLLGAIASMPHGKVILPGLDMESSADAWEAVNETHPQAGLKHFLAALEVPREAVRLWDEPDVSPSCPPARVQGLRAALLPAEIIADGWHQGIDCAEMLTGWQRADCAHLQEEARVLAIALREALETPGKTAAVVTADRTLARMVAAELRRFGVVIDDSSGQGLLDTPPAHFLLLLVEAALADAAPVPLLAVLKHPLCAAGLPLPECRRAARVLEKETLRGIRLAGGMRVLLRAEQDTQDNGVKRLLAALLEAFEPLLQLVHQRSVRFSTLLEVHIACAEALAEPGALFSGEAGEVLAAALAELTSHAQGLGEIAPSQYPALLRALLMRFTARAPRGEHPRVHILSPIEARLQHYDVLVLAGMNEASWPPEPEVSPWMSRAMRLKLGLSAPERGIGLAAHDFWMLSTAREVLITRAEKAGGVQTTPARWLTRLDTLLTAANGEAWRWQAPAALAWARKLNSPLPLPPLQPPAPVPPISARPRRLSVSALEQLQRDPYGIYAQYILRLLPLDPHDQEPNAREFGVVVHQALERFVRQYPSALPENALQALLQYGQEAFARYADRPAVRACWWPRFAVSAEWFVEQERQRRTALSEIAAEKKAEMVVDAPAGEFTLSTRLDRVEHGKHHNMRLVDYKTGGIPTADEVKTLISLQLPLGAAIACPEGQLEQVEMPEYWKIAGVNSQIVPYLKNKEAAKLAEYVSQALERARALVRQYDDPSQPYPAVPDMRHAPHHNAYEALERLAEWQGA